MKRDEQEQKPSTKSEGHNEVPKQPWVAPELICVLTRATQFGGLGANYGVATHTS
jgi:hypothetical protein